jgi:hypothetical protein
MFMDCKTQHSEDFNAQQIDIHNSREIWKRYWNRIISMPNIKKYYIAVVIKTVWYWWRDRHIDLWKRTRYQEIESYR